MVLMRDASNFDPAKGSLPAYLYGIARNHVLRRLDKERCYVPILEGGEDGEAAAPERLVAQDDPLGDLTRNEMIEAVRNAVLALPEHYREVIVLCDLHEMSYADAAQMAGCAVGTVRSRLHRARALLVEKLRANAQPDSGSKFFNPERVFA